MSGLKNNFEVTLTLNVDPEANFIEVGEEGICSGLKEVFMSFLYDIDDTQLVEINVKEKE
tara:strand:+ start:59 stop:238 length:180 start_codon:yes stop_codon:yes gene_type:complete